MHTGELTIKEIYLDSSARMTCPPNLIPRPGQYLLADQRGSDSPLAFPLFPSESTPEGFRSAPAIPSSWTPGTTLIARGPLGRGFEIPRAAKKIALIAYDDSPSRLRGLIPPALQQGAEVALLCDSSASDIHESVEVQPIRALRDILKWADYIAADLARENLQQFKTLLGSALPEAQLLLRAPMPCSGVAECGACALKAGHTWKMICKEGPVLRMEDLAR